MTFLKSRLYGMWYSLSVDDRAVIIYIYGQYLYRNVQFSKASLNGVLFCESIFEEGGNRRARRKPSKSGWDRLILNPHTTFALIEVEGVIDVRYVSLTSQGVQHRVLYLDGHPSRYQPRPTGLNFGEQTGTVFPLVIAVPLYVITLFHSMSL